MSKASADDMWNLSGPLLYGLVISVLFLPPDSGRNQFHKQSLASVGQSVLSPCAGCSLVFFFCLLFLLYFTLQYCMVLPYIDMNPHGCTCVPKHESPSHLPPHNISLGHHRAQAPSMLYPALDIDWRFNSYMIVYMLQCHSPK